MSSNHESWLAGHLDIQPISLAPNVVVRSGRVFVAAIQGSGPWYQVGTLDGDGMSLAWSTEGDEVEVMSWGEELIRTVRGGQLSFDGVSTSQLVEWGASGRRPATYEPARGADHTDIAEQIDRAIEQLCPCGAQPTPEFAPYCSYDCKPTHRALHTISETDGTQMRWRPDLVTEIDDTSLRPYIARTAMGDFWGEVFERAGALGGTRCFHLRLDDGYRFVGSDLVLRDDDDLGEDSPVGQLFLGKWEALRRELESSRHAVPSDPPQTWAVAGVARAYGQWRSWEDLAREILRR